MKRKSSTKVSVKKKNRSKKKTTVAAKPAVPQKVDIMDTKSYQIASVVRDKRGVVQYAKVGTQLYDMKTLFDLHEAGYRFYTSDDGVIKRDVLLVKRRGAKCYFVTEADWKKTNNLDYLPQPELTKE